MKTVKTNSITIPALGFGTWALKENTAYNMVRAALDIGYRHIDTAQMYGNEEEVGRAIKDSAVDRNDIFLTTKVWPDHFQKGVFQQSVQDSLRKLQAEAVDLLLLHWPNPKVPLAETIDALNEVKQKGWAHAIGVSNFTKDLLAQAVSLSQQPLAINQVEYHPYLDQSIVMAACQKHGMALTAYCPIARGQVFSDPFIQAIAARHNKSPAQITLRWLMQQEHVIAIPRSSKPEHAAANFDIFDFNLSKDEMREISALAHDKGRLVDIAELAPDWD